MNAMQGLRRLAANPLPADGDLPLLDKAHIDQIGAVLGSTRVEALLKLLSKELAARPAVIRDAVLAGDISRARHESHSFKGATMSVGAMELGRVAAAIEQASDLEAMARWVPELELQAARTSRAVANFLASNPASLEPD